MKKFLSAIIATLTFATFPLNAFAGVNPPQTTVSYTISDVTYSVNIPSTITVTSADTSVPITATTNFTAGINLCVRISNGIDAEGTITLTSPQENTEPTYFYFGEPETKITTLNNKVAEFTLVNTDSADPNIPLMIKGIDPTDIAAGTYTNTVQFTVAIE
jgi:hypothetical protein